MVIMMPVMSVACSVSSNVNNIFATILIIVLTMMVRVALVMFMRVLMNAAVPLAPNTGTASGLFTPTCALLGVHDHVRLTLVEVVILVDLFAQVLAEHANRLPLRRSHEAVLLESWHQVYS